AKPQADDDGALALQALTDVVALRQVLSRVEFEAVQAARRQGKSWAEIAVRLGITRQSAWERWQAGDQPDRGWRPVDSAVAQAVEAKVRTAAERRRQATVMVPSVLGMTWDDARSVLSDVSLVAGMPTPLMDSPAGGAVVDQSPEAGAR